MTDAAASRKNMVLVDQQWKATFEKGCQRRGKMNMIIEKVIPSSPKAELTAGQGEGIVNNNQCICYRQNDVFVLGYVE